MQKDHLEIPIAIEPNRFATLMVYGTSDKSKLFEVEDATRYGEAVCQLVEGCEYEYEIVSPDNDKIFQFVPVEEILRFSKRHANGGIIRQANKAIVRQLVTSSHRVSIHMDIQNKLRLSQRLKSIPNTLFVTGKEETVDVQENQFVKFALVSFYSFCLSLAQLKNANKRLICEAEAVSASLRHLLDIPFFRNVSPLTHFNLNSPILQRKEGYRQILQAWLMFDLAAKLSWNGGENVYSAGKRNVAALYEYWVFFKMLNLVSETFNISAEDKATLVKTDKDQINLELKQGQMTALRGSCEIATRRLNVCLYYNRTFSHHSELTHSGSWTTTMRPDYTLSIWPGNSSSEAAEEQAEKDDTIVHIHFDAKYRLADVPIVENLNEEKLSEEKDENVLHIYKRGDLLKMHAYKDAIRRTSGAYVLYPGNAAPKKIRGYHEIIPGLGAFCLSPGSAEDDVKVIKSFLIDVREHMLNRASERERMAYYAHDTYDESSEYSFRVLKDLLPEQVNDKRLLPNETYVLLGYYRDARHLKWIANTKNYNFRAGYTRNGTLSVSKEIVSAQYLLLHHGGDEMKMYRVSKNGPVVASRSELIRKGYPQVLRPDGTVDTEKERKKAVEIYLVFSVEPVEEELSRCKWSMANLKKYQGHQSAHPHCISLTDLMLLREK